MWIVLLLVHLFSNTGYNIALRHAASERKIDSLLLAAVMSTAIAVPAVVGVIICGVDFARFDVPAVWGFVGYVVTTLLFHVFNAKSLEHAEASVFTFLYNLRIGFVSLLGIMLLSEPVNVLRLIGGGLVFLAGVLIIERLRTNRMGALLSTISTVLISFVTMFEKGMIGAVGYTNVVFPAAIIIAAAVAVAGITLILNCFPFVIEHIYDGTLKTRGVVSKTFPLEQWETAFDYATRRYGDFKVAIIFP